MSAVVCATSPDGRVKCDFSIEDGRPVADISFCGRHAFRSELGMDFGRVKLTKSVSRTVRSSWKPVWGFKSGILWGQQHVLRRMARFLNRKSQRHYRLKFADSYYGELAHYGLHRLAWADVRRTRN